jgi:hypothetical protein
MCLSADSSLDYTAKPDQRLSAEFQFLVDWLPYSLDLNSLDFSISYVLQAKVQATPHSNLAALFPSIAAECDQLAVILYISAKHAAHSAAAMKPPLRKIKFELNKWLANSTAHTKQYFSGLQKLQ